MWRVRSKFLDILRHWSQSRWRNYTGLRLGRGFCTRSLYQCWDERKSGSPPCDPSSGRWGSPLVEENMQCPQWHTRQGRNCQPESLRRLCTGRRENMSHWEGSCSHRSCPKMWNIDTQTSPHRAVCILPGFGLGWNLQCCCPQRHNVAAVWSSLQLENLEKNLRDDEDYSKAAPSPFAEFRTRNIVTASKSIFKNYSIQDTSTTTREGWDKTTK